MLCGAKKEWERREKEGGHTRLKSSLEKRSVCCSSSVLLHLRPPWMLNLDFLAGVNPTSQVKGANG
ncbi:hypothetical protein INR49_029287 [Caranx melampygus]|nr:hypothetical protein INR49_029287 [Caranx melampygus]